MPPALRVRYRKAIRAVGSERRLKPKNAGYQIAKDATLAQCMGYTHRYVMGKETDQSHYRYGKYQFGLERTPTQHPIDGKIQDGAAFH